MMKLTDCFPESDEFISGLFDREYTNLVRLAQLIFEKRGGYVDPEGRAEEIVQEAFFLACERRDELLANPEPKKWLISTVSYKALEALRDDRQWARNLLLLPTEEESTNPTEPDMIAECIPREDYLLLRRLYVEGYTYRELCEELNISKSALAMRINRIKKACRETLEKNL